MSAELITGAEMRALERAAMDGGRVTGLELMERAGRGVVEAVFANWPALQAAPHRAVVLCGPGNNGGDGFVVARLLQQWGWAVEVYLYGDAARLPPDARANHARWCEIGAVHPLGPATWERRAFPGACDLVVDALFGIGGVRAVELPLETLTPELALGQRHKVVAVDLPSGLCSETGRVLGDEAQVVRADLTVTFHRAKPGHYLGDGPRYCGALALVDIGLEAPGQGVALIEAPLGTLGKGVGHKFSHGSALVLSGPMGRSGAARLAARAALRVGAGLVTLAAPGSAMMECAAQLTAVMLRRCDGAEGLAELMQDARLNALCLGPGLGLGEATRALVAEALGAGRATVLDADALSSFEAAPEQLFALTSAHRGAVLTPHGGEFARLFPDLAERLADGASKLEVTREAANRAGAVVLFKGHDTVIACPEGRVALHSAAYERAAPWLATAGSGDVLAGIITGLLARGFAAFEATATGVWLHVEAARAFGPGGIAEDLPEQLPEVLRGV